MNRALYKTYFVLEYTASGPIDYRTKALLSKRDDQTYYWSCGPQYVWISFFCDPVVLKRYGRRSFESVCRLYSRDFPPEPTNIDEWPVKDMAGWLAPTGEFFRCGWAEHSTLATDLIASFYPKADIDTDGNYWSNYEILHNIGWVHIQHGAVGQGKIPALITSLQKQTLEKLIALNIGVHETYSAGIERFLEHAEVTDGVIDPLRVPKNV